MTGRQWVSQRSRRRITARDPHVTIVNARAEGPDGVRWPFAIETRSHSDEGTVFTERLAARIAIDRRASSSRGISLAVVLRDLSRTYDADTVERR